jgi:hypothetical protein
MRDWIDEFCRDVWRWFVDFWTETLETMRAVSVVMIAMIGPIAALVGVYALFKHLIGR